MDQESVVMVIIRGHGQGSRVKDHWSEVRVTCQRSRITGQWSRVTGQSHGSVASGQTIFCHQTLYELKGWEIMSCSNEALKTGNAHSYGKTA